MGLLLELILVSSPMTIPLMWVASRKARQVLALPPLLLCDDDGASWVWPTVHPEHSIVLPPSNLVQAAKLSYAVKVNPIAMPQKSLPPSCGLHEVLGFFTDHSCWYVEYKLMRHFDVKREPSLPDNWMAVECQWTPNKVKVMIRISDTAKIFVEQSNPRHGENVNANTSPQIAFNHTDPPQTPSHGLIGAIDPNSFNCKRHQ
jgi:hypothetical protein